MPKPKSDNPVGRPLKYKTVKELQSAIDEYFAYCDNRMGSIYIKDLGDNIQISKPAPYTMSGLARHLGMDRDSLINYAHRDNYSALVKAARDKVAEDVETRLMETSNQSGAIFNLKNNFGWKDKTETDLTTGGDKLSPLMVQFIDGNSRNTN